MNRKKNTRAVAALLCGALLALVLLSGCSASAEPVKAQGKSYFTYFDTVTYIYSYAGDSAERFSDCSAEIADILGEYHQLFDIYHEYSGINNLCTVNKMAGGDAVAVDARLMEFLLYAKELYELTGGEMNVMMGSVLTLWHNAREAASEDPKNAYVPAEEELAEAAKHTDISLLELDEENNTVRISDPLASIDVGALGKGAPYRECLTHGWTVDGEGKAMHKSLGNGMDPAEIINEFGADMLRLWAGSADYHADMRCSKEIFKQLSQNYLKFRNTCKFMLDNLVDFDPEKLTKPEDMPVLDRWLLTKLNELIEKAEQSYCDYEFHIITHAVNDFCVNTLSSFYLDIVKDRLYCEGAESATRRSAQTALYLTLHTLSKLFAPILAFTCDEIWLAMPHTGDDDARNVVLNEMNKPFTAYALDSETMARWEHIIAVRTVVNGALEEARAAKVIGKSLEADVHLTVPEGDVFLADENPAALADLFIVSKVELTVGRELAVKVENAAGTKCPRCWKHSLTPNAEGLCPRCAEVVRHLPDLL